MVANLLPVLQQTDAEWENHSWCLKPTTQYIVSALYYDYSYLPAFHYAVLSLYGDENIIHPIVTEELSGTGWMNLTFPKVRSLVNYAEHLAGKLSRDIQSMFMTSMMYLESSVIIDTMIMLCEWNFMDSTTGGGLNVSLNGHGRRQFYDVNYRPSPKVRRRLYAPSAIRRYVNSDRSTIPVMKIVRNGLSQFPFSSNPNIHPLADFFRISKIRYDETNQALINRYSVAYKNAHMPRKEIKRKRTVLNRSISAASSIVGLDVAKSFLAGKPVIVTDGTVQLSIVRSPDVFSTDVLSLDIHILDMENQKLSDLCLYFDDTPMFDQLGAIALYVAAGQMKELLQIGNMLNITDLGYQHPIIREKLLSPIPEDQFAEIRRVQLKLMNLIERGANTEQIETHRKQCQKEAVTEYTKAVGHHYARAIISAIWGSSFKINVSVKP